jgi:hypothetical protein
MIIQKEYKGSMCKKGRIVVLNFLISICCLPYSESMEKLEKGILKIVRNSIIWIGKGKEKKI